MQNHKLKRFLKKVASTYKSVKSVMRFYTIQDNIT